MDVAFADGLRGVFRMHVLLLLHVRLCQRHLVQRELLNPPVLNLSYWVWADNSCLTRLSVLRSAFGRPCDELLVAVRGASHTSQYMHL